jgi:hypothetical protein
VRESCTLGSVGAKAEWLSYPTITSGKGLSVNSPKGSGVASKLRGRL